MSGNVGVDSYWVTDAKPRLENLVNNRIADGQQLEADWDSIHEITVQGTDKAVAVFVSYDGQKYVLACYYAKEGNTWAQRPYNIGWVGALPGTRGSSTPRFEDPRWDGL